MAGVKGRSGGARPGSGPKPKPENAAKGPSEPAKAGDSPLDYLLSIMRDPAAPLSERRKAAQAAAPYLHARAGAARPAKADEQAAGTPRDGTAAPPSWDGLLQ